MVNLKIKDLLKSLFEGRYKFKNVLDVEKKIKENKTDTIIDNLIMKNIIEKIVKVTTTNTNEKIMITRIIDDSLFTNYTKNYIHRTGILYAHLLDVAEKISKQKRNICFLGFGGGNSNFAKWLSNISKIIQKPIFEKVVVIEGDEIELTNLPRLPVPERPPVKKIDLAKLIVPDFSNETIYIEDFLAEENLDKYKWLKDNGFTIIGGPDLQIRKLLALEKFDALYPASANDDYEIIIGDTYENIDLELIAEGYGLINLGFYQYAIFKMFEELLYQIAEDRRERWKLEVPAKVKSKLDSSDIYIHIFVINEYLDLKIFI